MNKRWISRVLQQVGIKHRWKNNDKLILHTVKNSRLDFIEIDSFLRNSGLESRSYVIDYNVKPIRVVSIYEKIRETGSCVLVSQSRRKLPVPLN